ncbi:MAG TPA: hypothetical protein VM406_16105 [Noviherbaspirillum sp.]|nr:hypothetical protein [Noviherbaspirillum sp.]
MHLMTLGVLAVILIPLALYAQMQIGSHTRGAGRVALTRLLLLAVGLAFGWVVSANAVEPAERFLVFVAGFGMVHVPAAVILFIKKRRGSGRT